MIAFTAECPICEKTTPFTISGVWLRGEFRCVECSSIPRERPLIAVIQMLYPHWRDLRIHESSPGGRGASVKLQRDCPAYIATQFNSKLAQGATDVEGGYRNENLEA